MDTRTNYNSWVKCFSWAGLHIERHQQHEKSHHGSLGQWPGWYDQQVWVEDVSHPAVQAVRREPGTPVWRWRRRLRWRFWLNVIIFQLYNEKIRLPQFWSIFLWSFYFLMCNHFVTAFVEKRSFDKPTLLYLWLLLIILKWSYFEQLYQQTTL